MGGQQTGRATRASIFAQDVNGVIGDGYRMLWRVPGDLAFFKSQTMGCPLIMGRGSFEAMGGPLPGRTNIVLTTNRDYSADGAHVVHSLEEAFSLAEEAAQGTDTKTIWVIGGAQVFASTMDMVDELYVTDLDLKVTPEADAHLVYAPTIDPHDWEVVSTDKEWRERSGDAPWRVTVYRRRQA